MSIATEITRLQGIKTDIRSALVEQGIEDAGTHDMADFADDILAIEGGGGELHGAIVSVTTEEETLAGTMAELYKVIGGVEELVDSKRFSELNDDGVASVGFVIQYAGTYIVRASDGTDSADSGNFDVSAEQIVNVESLPIMDVNFVRLEWVSFADNSIPDEKIQAIIDAYYAGKITYDDIKANTTGWNVGDTRKFNIGGTKVKFVIIGTEHDDLSDGSGKALLTLHSVTTYTTHAMNSTDTNTNGWSGSQMRSWLQSDTLVKLKNNPIINNCVKSVTKWTNNKGGNTSDCSATTDSIFLLSEKEIFGAKSYCRQEEFNKAEMKQYEYYKTASNRIKTGASAFWWERSPYSGNTYYFCRVSSSGSASNNDASSTIGVAPALCL